MRIAIFSFVLIAVAFCRGEEPGQTDRKQLAQQYVKELGSDDYAERFRAGEKLIALRRDAIEALESAAQSTDAEVRVRAVKILIALRGPGLVGIVPNEIPANELDSSLPEDDAVVKISVGLGGRSPNQNNDLMPAEAAGIQAGDIIEDINGRPLRGGLDLRRTVMIAGPGKVVLLTVERNSKVLRIPVQLTRNKNPRQTYDANGQLHQDPPPPVDLESEGAPNQQVQRAIQVPNILEQPAQPAPRQQKLEIRVAPAPAVVAPPPLQQQPLQQPQQQQPNR